ncbi:MAG: hypothetical protein ABIF87_01815 [Pseudomonadota bacterium]
MTLERVRRIQPARLLYEWLCHDVFPGSVPAAISTAPAKTVEPQQLEKFFHITDIPKDSQLRQVLDAADNAQVYELFADLFRSLQRSKQLELFRFSDDRYLLSLG